jgi:hypothetical protein
MTNNTLLKMTALGFGLALGAGALTAASCIPDPEPTPTPSTQIAEPVVTDDSPIIQEDDPRWDCRTMGNLQCGVEVKGTIYILDFATGTFTQRG